MKNKEAIEAIRSFNRFYTNVIGVVDRHILGSSFSLTEVRVLWQIAHERECSAREIKAVLQVDEGYLSRTISTLMGQGLIERRRSQNDARVYVLSLSEKGAGVFGELSKRAEVAIESLVSSLSRSEISKIVTCMRRIQKILAKEGR